VQSSISRRLSNAIRRRSVKTIDIWEIDYQQDLHIVGRTPILYRRGDNVEIRYGNGIGWSVNTRGFRGEKERHTRLHETFNKLKLSPEDRKEFIKDILSWTPAEILSNSRSLDLLSEWISKKELKYWEKHGEITIQSSRPNKQYVITKERLDRTQVIIDGRIDHTLCVQSTENYDLPYGDALLAKVVALKSNEEYFLNRSNRFEVSVIERREYEKRHPPPTTTTVNRNNNNTVQARDWPSGLMISGTTAQQITRSEIAPRNIGLQGGVYQGLTDTDTRALEDAVQQYTQAQATLDGLATTNNNGLAVRDIAGEATPPVPPPTNSQAVWNLGHRVNPAGIGGSEEGLRLRSRADTIDIQRIGHVSALPFQTHINPVYMNQCIMMVAAQGLIDGISTVEEGMAIRSLLPDLDFRDSGNADIRSRDWEQPCSPFFFPDNLSNNLLNGNYRRYQIYQTNRNSDNNVKTMLLYGIANLDLRNRNLASSLIIQRGNVKVVDVVDLSYSANVSFIPFRQPIMFKRGDNMNLYLELKPEAAGQRSHYMLLGMVAEAIGANLCG
jgi:hypothetical protein